MDHIEALNRALFLQINAPEGAGPWIVHVAIVLADDLVYLIPVLLLALWLWGDEARRRLAIEACVVALLGVGVNQLIALVWQHPRPFMIGIGRTLIPHAADSSFPSDHMVVFCSVGFVLLLGGELWLGLAASIAGLRRMGAHLPRRALSIGHAGLRDGCRRLLCHRCARLAARRPEGDAACRTGLSKAPGSPDPLGMGAPLAQSTGHLTPVQRRLDAPRRDRRPLSPRKRDARNAMNSRLLKAIKRRLTDETS